MFKKMWSLKAELTKYFLIGTSGVFIDLLTLILLKEFFGLNPVISVIINQLIMIVYIFCLNKYWTFKNKTMPQRQLVRFMILFIVNYFISIGIMYYFNKIMNFDYRIIRIANIAVSTFWNFALYKYWVYKD